MSDSEYKDNLNIYTAPNTGIYEVSDLIYRATPTGNFEQVKNPNRKWFEFWEPRMITKEIFLIEKVNSGRRITQLSKGEVVRSAFDPRKL